MPKERRNPPREKKLFQDELCHCCRSRPAKGFKYNAISCDACRVFFRRVVKESDEEADYQLPECLCGTMVNTRCQSCRFKLCLDAGMKREFVSGTSFYRDNRTVSKLSSQPTTFVGYLDDTNSHFIDKCKTLFEAYVKGFAENSGGGSELSQLTQSSSSSINVPSHTVTGLGYRLEFERDLGLEYDHPL